MQDSIADWLALNDEVLVPKTPIVKVTPLLVAQLKEKALANPRGKCRLLLHANADAALHELVIVHPREAYIQPHQNTWSSKSYHLIEGSMVVVLFEDDGRIKETCRMSDAAASDCRILRMGVPVFHTVIPCSDQVVFAETILGPFRGTIYASFAPTPDQTELAADYFRRLNFAISTEGGGEI